MRLRAIGRVWGLAWASAFAASCVMSAGGGGDDHDTDAGAGGDADSDSDADACPDEDGDGYAAQACGGGDCDDASVAAHPGALDGEGVGQWVVQTVDEEVATASADLVAVAVDASAAPHVAYTMQDRRELRYATRIGDAWTIETVEPAADDRLSSLSMAMDPEGRPHVGYTFGRSSFEVRHAERSGDAWTIEPVWEPGPFGGASLGVADDGTVHVAFAHKTNLVSQLVHAWRSAGTWSVETVASSSAPYNTTVGGVLAVEGSDVHTLYWHTVSLLPELNRFYYRTDGVDLVVEHGSTTSGKSIVVESGGGTVHMTYVNDAGLVHATRSAPDPVVRGTADSTDVRLDGGTDVAVDAQGAFHAVYMASHSTDVYSDGFELRHATDADGPALHETIEMGPSFGAPAIAAYGGDLHVCWRDRELGRVRCGTKAGPDGVDQDCDGEDG